MAVTGNKATSTKSSAAAPKKTPQTPQWTLPKRTSTTTVQPNANRPINPALIVRREGEACVLVPWVDTAKVTRGSASVSGDLLFEGNTDPAFRAAGVQVRSDQDGSPIHCGIADCDFTLTVTDFEGAPVVIRHPDPSAGNFSAPELKLEVSRTWWCHYAATTCPQQANQIALPVVVNHSFALAASAINIGSIDRVTCQDQRLERDKPVLAQDLQDGLAPLAGPGDHSDDFNLNTSHSSSLICNVQWTGLNGLLPSPTKTFISTCPNDPPACIPEETYGQCTDRHAIGIGIWLVSLIGCAF